MKTETIDILDEGTVQRLTYQGLLAVHDGRAVWGASVGYRAMQAAGWTLSHGQLWDRKDLSVVSAHPGPGVRDAIEFVTRCVSRNRFQLLDPGQPAGCHQDMQYRWWVTHQAHTVEVTLREGFVPPQFFELTGRVGSEREGPDDSLTLETLKVDLSRRLWDEPLHTLFHLTVGATPGLPDRLPCTN